MRTELAPDSATVGRLADRTQALADLAALLADIDPAWLAAARAAADPGQPPAPSVDDVVALTLPRLGWRLPSGHAVPLSKFAVRLGTALQLGDLTAARSACHCAYVREALCLPVGAVPPDSQLVALRSTFRRVWREWENENKEVLWRLAVDGVPMVGNSHMGGAAEACACGVFPGPDPAAPVESVRAHHFWTCPVADQLRDVLSSRAGCAVQRHHVWLCVSPDPDRIAQCVWDVVTLAALAGLEHARRHIHACRAAPTPAVAARASLRAVSVFWSHLHDFAALGVPRRGRWPELPPTHPFLRVVGGRLRAESV